MFYKLHEITNKIKILRYKNQKDFKLCLFEFENTGRVVGSTGSMADNFSVMSFPIYAQCVYTVFCGGKWYWNTARSIHLYIVYDWFLL